MIEVSKWVTVIIGNRGNMMLSSSNSREILLESGTNELEIIEFGISDSRFAINVMKVREIMEPIPVSKVPNSHRFVEGIIEIRDEVMPVIDLPAVLGLPVAGEGNSGKFIVSELNKMKVVFHVETVSRIHRISWEQIEKPADFFQGAEGLLIGIVKMQDGMVLLLDFEKILVEVDPQAGLNVNSIKNISQRERKDKNIMVAEDSPLLRKMLEETLNRAGYNQLQFFPNGKQAWDHLENLAQQKKEKAFEDVHLLVTDIEMPQMDGLHLTKRIKEHPLLKRLPVIVFSSLISDDLRHKGETIGANAQVTKPEIGYLVETIDELVL